MKWTQLFMLLALAALLAGAASAATYPATLIVQEGDAVPGLPGSVISLLYPATVDSQGTVTFTGRTAAGTSFVVTNGQLAWSSTTSSMQSFARTAFLGEWVARVQVSGSVTEHSDLGPIVQVGDFVGAYRVTQLGRGREMTPNGVAYMLAQVRIPGQPLFGVALVSPTRAPGDVDFEIHPTDTFDGSTPSGIGVLSLDFSDTLEAYTIQLRSPLRGSLVVNGTALAVSGDSIPNQGGAAWLGDFLAVSANNQYVVFKAARSDGSSPDVIGHWTSLGLSGSGLPKQSFAAGDCLVLTNPPPVPSISKCFSQIDDTTELRDPTLAPDLANEVAFVGINAFSHPTNPADEFLFYSCNAGNIARTPATLLLSRFDSVDLDGDGTGDATVDRIGLGHSSGRLLTVTGNSILVPVELISGGQLREAIVSVPRPACFSGG